MVTSTPVKSADQGCSGLLGAASPIYTKEQSFSMEEEDSFSGVQQRLDQADQTYRPSSDESEDSEMDITEEIDGPVTNKKYIVFHDSLMTLMNSLLCPCTNPPSPTDTVEQYELGSSLTMTAYCINGHRIMKWDSQPKYGRMPVGNLLLCGAVLCSGQTYERVAHMCNLVNIRFPSRTTFDTYQRDYLIPEIDLAWECEQNAAIQEVTERGDSIRLAGDGRCDSPGFCAKYCLYSHMDQATNKLLSLQLVQVTETGSSSRMEVLGYERGMDYLLARGVTIELCATDRHVQVRKKHKDMYAPMNIKHEFDVYHLAGHIRKKIKALAQKPKLRKLGPWVKSLVNHLWWSAATCDGNAELLLEKWTSVVHHVSNQHVFPENRLYTECQHGELEETLERRTKWLPRDSKELEALESVVMNKLLLRDIRLLSQFCHTGMLEVFHSMLLKYAPKRQEFSYPQMQARLQLAAIDHNRNVYREQAVVQYPRRGSAPRGAPRYSTKWSKATAQWVVTPIKVPKSYDFATEILEAVVGRREAGEMLPLVPVPEHIPRNIAPHQMPGTKEDLVNAHRTRFVQ